MKIEFGQRIITDSLTVRLFKEKGTENECIECQV